MTDVLKVFVEEPAVLAASRDAEAGEASLDALLGGVASGYGRVYLAGTRLGGDRPRVGLTALTDASLYVAPLLAWARDRAWTCLDRGGAHAGALAAEAAAALAHPAETSALAVGPTDGRLLSEVAAGDRGDALRALLALGPDAAVLVPHPAHDGFDWAVFGHSPLGLVAAVRARATPPGARRFVAPYRRAHGEHTFYFEQWALDPPPTWAEEL